MVFFIDDFCEFFKDLVKNNYCDWFNDNKKWYEFFVKKFFEVFIVEMLDCICMEDFWV